MWMIVDSMTYCNLVGIDVKCLKESDLGRNSNSIIFSKSKNQHDFTQPKYKIYSNKLHI